MEEQPGGGAAAAAGAAALSPRQQPQLGGGAPLGAVLVPQQSDELQRPQQQYSIPGILHYIQHEWARFEMERAHWEVERAELQVRSRAQPGWGAGPGQRRLRPPGAVFQRNWDV